MASLDFTELFTTITTTPTTETWTTFDLTSKGVPDNVVACILVKLDVDGAPALCGVRKVGSSLSRYVNLHEPEGGGATTTIMHVQLDSTASFQYYAENNSQDFILLGYYGSEITYTEEMTLHEPTVAGWRSTAVGQNNTVFEFSCQNIDAGNTAENVGTRKVGSSLARYQDIHEAEPSGINTYTSYVQSDASGNVELHRADAYGKFYRLGYFSSNVQLEERFDLCTPASDGAWGEQTIVAGGENCVGLICCMHQSNNTEEFTGARGGASAVNRSWNEHESETDQYTGDTLPVLIDASGKYDTYFGDVSDGYFHCLGYLFVAGPQTFYQNSGQGANAPTGILNKQGYKDTGGYATVLTGSLGAASIFLVSVGAYAMAIAGALGTVVIFVRGVGSYAMTLAGGLKRQTHKAVGGYSMTVIGNLVKQSFKCIGGYVMTMLGTLSTATIFLQTAGQAALTISGSLIKKIFISIGNGVVSSVGGSVKKLFLLVGSGAVVSVGSLIKKIFLSVGSGAVSSVGDLIKKTSIFIGKAATSILGVLSKTFTAGGAIKRGIALLLQLISK